jgi:imidazolonepropionase-like amidohydrolase
VVHEAATPDQAREFVRFEAAKKVDIIKFWDDDRNHTKPKMPPDIYKAIIDEAHKQNVPVIAHIFELQEAKGVAAAGINGIAHPVRDKPVDDEFVKLMKDHDVFQCSNLSPMAPRTWLDDPALAETEPQSVTAQFKGSNAGGGGNNVFSLAQHNEKVENDAGIRILLCGDTAGVPAQYPGYSEHRELQALVGAGISPIQVIHDATEVSAKALGLNDTGVLTPGKRADFLVLSGNPLDDMSNTLKIASIYRDGRSIDRNALRAKITAAMGQ